jgi:hypothetical protein
MPMTYEQLDELATGRAREITVLRVRIEALEGYMRGLLGLTEMLCHNDDAPEIIKHILRTNHRVIDARSALSQEPST